MVTRYQYANVVHIMVTRIVPWKNLEGLTRSPGRRIDCCTSPGNFDIGSDPNPQACAYACMHVCVFVFVFDIDFNPQSCPCRIVCKSEPVIDLGVSVPVERVLLPAALRGGAGGGGGHLGGQDKWEGTRSEWWKENEELLRWDELMA